MDKTMSGEELDLATEQLRTLRAKRHHMSSTCGQCSGSGRIAAFSHISGGVCFACEGTGRSLPRSKRDLAAHRTLETAIADLEGRLAAHNRAVDALDLPLPDLDTIDLSALVR